MLYMDHCLQPWHNMEFNRSVHAPTHVCVAQLCSYVLLHSNALVTNESICVALYLCNAQKRNASLSVGKCASNAYIGI
jgi:hypothetical protein